MTRKKRLVLLIGAVTIPVPLLAAWILLPYIFPARGCFLFESAVEEMRVLNLSLVTYESTYGSYPDSLSALGPVPSGKVASAKAAGLIGAQLASGNKLGYRFYYSLRRNPAGKREIEGYSVSADPLAEGPGLHHYFTDDTAVVRSEKNHPATAESPETHDPTCTCDEGYQEYRREHGWKD